MDHLIDDRAHDNAAVLADATGFAGHPCHQFGTGPKELYVANQLLHNPHPQATAPTNGPYLGFGPPERVDFIWPTHAAPSKERAVLRAPDGVPNPLVGPRMRSGMQATPPDPHRIAPAGTEKADDREKQGNDPCDLPSLRARRKSPSDAPNVGARHHDPFPGATQ